MAGNPQVLGLLEEMLDSGKTPEEVCRDCPELLPEVRRRWQEFQLIDEQVKTLLPGLATRPAAGAPAPPAAGLPQVPGYEVEAVLGRGGMGVVYRARHLALKRTVALKMLATGHSHQGERARFRAEAEAVARLQHPNIVQIHEVGEADGRPFFALEYVAGGSLAERLAGQPLPPRDAARLVAALAEAMHLAHSRNLVHRDLKPGNVLLAGEADTPVGQCQPKVTDFGLVRQLDADSGQTFVGEVMGTPSYMAPEQALGKAREVGTAADTYALGAILYELLTGRPPFRAETATETLQQVISQEPVPPSRLNAAVPRDAETICLKCLEKQPHCRYPSAAALADDLHRFQRGDPIAARPVQGLERLVRWMRRDPTRAALVATVLALFVLALGGWLWLERQRAERLAERARQEGRADQALEVALEQAAAFRKQGRWPEVRAALEGVASLLDTSARADLRERLHEARADADMVLDLEEIRLRLSEGGTGQEKPSLSPDQAYAEAFRKYGIALTAPEPAEAAARIRNSAIRETLLAFLYDWLYWVSDANRAKLRALLDEADDDEWRREFREALAVKDAGKLKALARAEEAVTQPPVVLSGLAGSLLGGDHRLEALALLREAQQRHPEDFWINYLLGHYWAKERAPEAVGYCWAAVAIRPSSDQAYALLGRALRGRGDTYGASAAFRKALALNPNCAVGKDLASAVDSRGGLEEARVAWEKLVNRDPPSHDAWYGYAELCLFLDKREAYRWARKRLLERFAETAKDWITAERTSQACLLLPASGDELRRAVMLADRAVAAAAKSREPSNPYVRFVKGLAEYRLGRYEPAVPWLQASAAKLPNRVGPRLVLAMAQFQSGSAKEARKTLAAAVRAYDWNESAPASRTDPPVVWVSHVLRREAEAMILPNLPAFLRGEYRPQDNDERLALLGVCQVEGRYGAAARLYADAFAADPRLADDLTRERLGQTRAPEHPADPIEVFNAACRYHAARFAALAGCGLGRDGAKLNDAERTRWRRQAREWLRADLAAWAKMLDGDSQVARDLAKRMLKHWQVDPDLAGLRDPGALAALSRGEREECLALWNEVAAGLSRAQATK
jgi:serine/threonine-protein kinase